MTPPHEDERRIDADRLDLLLNQSQSVLLANAVNPLVLALIAGRPSSFAPWGAWVLAQILLSAWRWQGRRSLRRRMQDGDLRGAAVRATSYSLASGLFWGVGAALLLDPRPASLLAWNFVVGGMVTAAAGTTAVHFPSFVAFTVGALAPLAFRLASFPVHDVGPMPVLVLLFGGLMTVIARRTHQSLGQSFRLRHENADLIGKLGRAQSELVQTNRDLEAVVEARTAELVAQRARLAQWIRDTPDGLLSLVDGAVVAFNPALQRILKRSSELLLGETLDRLPGFDSVRATTLLEACAREGQGTSEIALEGDSDDDARTLEVHASRAAGREGQVELVIRDVTERRRAERRLRALEEDAQRAARLTAVRRLSGGVAHEFNNVLAVILGTAERLLRSELPAHARTGLEELQTAGVRAAGVTRQLLSVSQRRHGKAAIVALDDFLRGHRDTLERLTGQEVKVRLQLSEETKRIRVDVGQLEEILLHLLLHLTALSERSGAQDEIELRTTKAQDLGTLEMAYVSTEPLPERPGRSHVEHDESALDLAAARGLVLQQGGTFARLAEGPLRTGFRLTWPLVPEEPQRPAPEPPRLSAPSGAPVTVLVVDDEPVLREIVASVLRHGGYHVLLASSAAEALQLSGEHEQIDVLLTDVVMPGKDGPTLARELRTSRPGLRVCFMSGYTASFLSASLAEFPGAVLLEKPFAMGALLGTVAEVAQAAQARA